VLQASYLKEQLNNFVPLIFVANFFRTEFMFLPFSQFQYFILCSRFLLKVFGTPPLCLYTQNVPETGDHILHTWSMDQNKNKNSYKHVS